MDDRYVYVFLRQDLPIALQLVHACHAVYHVTCNYRPDEGVPCLVVIGVPNPAALARVVKKLQEKQLPHFVWNDPDEKFGAISIATAPLNHTERNYLKEYRLYPLNADVAQLREHRTSSPEVAGANPAVGSTLEDAIAAVEPKKNSILFVDAKRIQVSALAKVQWPVGFEGGVIVGVLPEKDMSVSDAFLMMSREEAFQTLQELSKRDPDIKH